MDVIAMIKKSSRINYIYEGKSLNIKEIYSRNKKRRGLFRYLLSIDVMIGKDNPVSARIVCVCNKANCKDWLAFICTDSTFILTSTPLMIWACFHMHGFYLHPDLHAVDDLGLLSYARILLLAKKRLSVSMANAGR